mmetsp:Transcript_29108/g.47038  ORF Transcript_29108/g.47038 Transcript_29108/m.47038 type:complete len:463 (-) Transcript_29108:977-2365(-)|eukprot:CAMPEP_0184335992 /NCGR_PEP_ID=MMETSP1089-20130417/4458_1 /TAXON_ID=38269 ORGANISM="Gloeochaete wittrockiana, Strain SAG46.84" /NCGR_SAMPLE_ID=MMETSP1089 /ASSEMBLY_ACC=CAM_ASM_000445 /LENGTH=462 /DNA_ID=CAMNT_0026660907 /DNA_START=45 /DNA_END=1433 /DNA_ORIENTATION=+
MADSDDHASLLLFNDGLQISECEEAADYILTDLHLRRLAGMEHLGEVTFLETNVDSTQLIIGDLGLRLPKLIKLRLNNSKIPVLRDLGTSLKHVQILWISRSEVKDLQGIAALESLKELYISYNDINDLYPLGGQERLEILDLEGNCVDDMNQISLLSTCSSLTSLSLESNPVHSIDGYRSLVFQQLRNLCILDDVPRSSSDMLKSTGESMLGVEPEDEKTIVTRGIKHARHGFDDVYFSLPGLDDFLSEAPFDFTLFSATDPPKTPQHRNPCSTPPRPLSSSARIRPGSSPGRPQSAVNPGQSCPGQRPGTSSPVLRSSSADSRSRLNLPVNFSSKSVEEDSSSDLTFGSAAHLCGNPGMALRAWKSKHLLEKDECAGDAGDGDSGSMDPLCTEELLNHLRNWKIETATIALADDPPEDTSLSRDSIYRPDTVEKEPVSAKPPLAPRPPSIGRRERTVTAV